MSLERKSIPFLGAISIPINFAALGQVWEKIAYYIGFEFIMIRDMHDNTWNDARSNETQLKINNLQKLKQLGDFEKLRFS